MQVLLDTAYLAPGQAQSAADIVLNGQQVVDEAEFFRAASVTFYPRGNQRTTFEFSVNYVYATAVLAEVALLTFPSQVPMTALATGMLQCLCGAETPATSQICYMPGSVLERIAVTQIGVSLKVRYFIVGPGFTTSTPGQGLPTFPNPNEIVQVFRRGKILITPGATTVAVVFSSALPGTPGCDPECYVSATTGLAGFEAWALTDTVTTAGFTAQLAAACPVSGTYYLNYVVFM
jgi:hypothetical protein